MTESAVLNSSARVSTCTSLWNSRSTGDFNDWAAACARANHRGGDVGGRGRSVLPLVQMERERVKAHPEQHGQLPRCSDEKQNVAGVDRASLATDLPNDRLRDERASFRSKAS